MIRVLHQPPDQATPVVEGVDFAVTSQKYWLSVDVGSQGV